MKTMATSASSLFLLTSCLLAMWSSSGFTPSRATMPPSFITPHTFSPHAPFITATTSNSRPLWLPIITRSKPLFSQVSPRPPPPPPKDDEEDEKQPPNLNPFSAEGRPVRPPPKGITIPPQPTFRIVINGALASASLGLVAAVLGYFFKVSPFEGINFDTSSLVIGALLALPFFGLDQYLQLAQEDTMTEVYSLNMFGARSKFPVVVGCALLLAVATGVGEEALFRGLIQQGLTNNIGTWPGLLVASVIFGVAHSLAPSDLGFLALFGGYCGVAYIFSDHNIVVPTMTHTVYDALVLLAAYYRGRGHLEDPRQQHLMPPHHDE